MVKCTCGVEYDETDLGQFAEHVHDEGRPTEPVGPPDEFHVANGYNFRWRVPIDAQPIVRGSLWVGETQPSLEKLAEGLQRLDIDPKDPDYWSKLTFAHMALAPSLVST